VKCFPPSSSPFLPPFFPCVFLDAFLGRSVENPAPSLIFSPPHCRSLLSRGAFASPPVVRSTSAPGPPPFLSQSPSAISPFNKVSPGFVCPFSLTDFNLKDFPSEISPPSHAELFGAVCSRKTLPTTVSLYRASILGQEVRKFSPKCPRPLPWSVCCPNDPPFCPADGFLSRATPIDLILVEFIPVPPLLFTGRQYFEFLQVAAQISLSPEAFPPLKRSIFQRFFESLA